MVHNSMYVNCARNILLVSATPRISGVVTPCSGRHPAHIGLVLGYLGVGGGGSDARALRARTLGNEQRVALSRVCPVLELHFYATPPQLCPAIAEHYARSDVA